MLCVRLVHEWLDMSLSIIRNVGVVLCQIRVNFNKVNYGTAAITVNVQVAKSKNKIKGNLKVMTAGTSTER